MRNEGNETCVDPYKNNPGKVNATKSNAQLSKISNLSYEIDLENWEEDVKPTRTIVHTDLHRVWGSAPTENEIQIPCSSGLQRVIEFSGE